MKKILFAFAVFAATASSLPASANPYVYQWSEKFYAGYSIVADCARENEYDTWNIVIKPVGRTSTPTLVKSSVGTPTKYSEQWRLHANYDGHVNVVLTNHRPETMTCTFTIGQGS